MDRSPSREELLKALSGLPHPVLTVSEDGRILYLSPAAGRQLKLDPEGAFGQAFPYPLAEGRLRDLDLELSIRPVEWGGEPCRLIMLAPPPPGVFHLEWRLEAAEEAAREAEARVVHLQTRVRQLEEQLDRTEELESLLESAEQRVDEATQRAEEAERRLGSREEEPAGEETETEADLADYRDLVADLEEQLAEAQQRADEFDEAVMLTGRRNEELEATVERLEKDRAEAEERLAQVDAFRRRVAELERRLARSEDLASALALSEKRLREIGKRAEDAEDRLREAQKLLSSYQRRLADQPQPTAEPDLAEPAAAGPAFKDELTHLPTASVIGRHLDLTLKQNARYGGRTALLWIDLDRFKVINDAMGPRVGDELLKAVASRLESVVRGSDVLGRRGEDEYLILLSELKGQEEATSMASAVARRVYEVLAPPFSVLGQKLYMGASIGISLFPGDSRTSAQMLEHAESAMFRAKELGRGRYQFYTLELQQQHEVRQKLVESLRGALDAQQFRLVYQPVIDLRSGGVMGVEALLRWEHPQFGLLEPDKFLEVAEDTGMIVPIGRWTILQACEQARRWMDEGLEIFTSINLSARQVLQADLGPVFARTLDLTRAAPAFIVAEIAETTYDLDPNRVDPVIQSLRDLGLRIAVDRFGTGSSSLERLAAGHVSFLKVDRRLTARIPGDRAATGIVLGALGLARSLRLTPVVVGVENDQQKNLLKRLECELVQGNFLAPPLTGAQVSRVAGRSYA